MTELHRLEGGPQDGLVCEVGGGRLAPALLLSVPRSPQLGEDALPAVVWAEERQWYEHPAEGPE